MAKKNNTNMDKILEFVTDRDSDDDIDLGESDYEGSDSDFDLYDEDEDVPEPQFVPDDIPHPVAEYVVGEEEDEVDTEDLPVSRSNDISDDDEPLAKLAKGCASEQSTSDDTTDLGQSINKMFTKVQFMVPPFPESKSSGLYRVSESKLRNNK